MKRIIIFLLVISVILCGCSKQNNDIEDIVVEPEEEIEQLEEREIILYFSNSQAEYVVPEHRIIKVKKGISHEDYAKIVLEELIKGPKAENLYKTIPEEVKVLYVKIEDDTIYIDFSKEMHTKHWGGAAGEDMTICSLANTMTELEGIKYVMPSVEGVALNIEHMIIEQPLERMEERIYR
ncbi:GerMN domain-containing protein [Lutispora thermophila]|uniref:Sporulation and spore germination n=1 Tax=Lutispora thermophila DSM 19022 TaxID=1122184 RepID=A0A1M6EXH7_9FIRM|nr:GerMN domain-containing protein [Lutispora thermophila]SHI90123.1 Sporulation and spore germination [Lutispora thermophila DSM 19022]